MAGMAPSHGSAAGAVVFGGMQMGKGGKAGRYGELLNRWMPLEGWEGGEEKAEEYAVASNPPPPSDHHCGVSGGAAACVTAKGKGDSKPLWMRLPELRLLEM